MLKNRQRQRSFPTNLYNSRARPTVLAVGTSWVVYFIGIGRFRILAGGSRFKILGEPRGGGGGQIPSRHMTSCAH